MSTPHIRVPGGLPRSEAAPYKMVSRTQRIILQRATTMQERRLRTRSLWIPVILCSVLLASIFYAIWQVLSQEDLTPTGVPDSNYQLVFILLWVLPMTAAMLGMVWLRRSRRYGRRDEVQQ